MNEYTARALATFASALICGFLMLLTEGKRGIGWFIFSLFIIW
jgi:hypothetical protein